MAYRKSDDDLFSPFPTPKKEVLSPGPRREFVQPAPIRTPTLPTVNNNPVIGENLFLANTFPIHKNDNPLVKGLKGIGNFGTSLWAAPGEMLRKGVLQGSSLLQGNGLQSLPKNTSFTGDILPKGASNAIGNFQQSHPTLGNLAQMGIETATDPTTFIGSKTITELLKPKSQIDLVRTTLPDNPFSGAFNDVQSKPISKPKQTITLPKVNAQNVTQQAVEPIQPNLESLKPNLETTPFGDISKWDKNTYDTTINALKAENEDKLQQTIDYFTNYKSQGVEPGGLATDQFGDVVNRWGRISNNEPWYQDLYSKLGRKPNKSELKQLALEEARKDPSYIKNEQDIVELSKYATAQPSKIELPKLQVQKIEPLKVMAADIEKNTVGNLATQPSYSLSKVVGGNSTFGEPTIPGGVKEHGFGRNVRTDEGMNPAIRQDFTGDPATYTQLANKDTLAKAEARFNKGYEKSLDDWNSSLETFRADDVPLARLLANEAANRGDLATARKIIDDVSDKLTQAGQFGQAARILRQSSDPGSFMININKQFNKLNEQGRKAYGKNWNDIRLTDDEMTTLSKEWGELDEEGRIKLTENIYKRINDELPVSNMEKFDTWRRIAMLLNPKTHARNMIGNTIMAGARKLSDTIAAGLEKAAKIPKAERTKSVGWSRDKTLVDTVQTEWETAKPDLTHVTRWDLEQNMSLGNMDKRIFKNNALNAVDKFSKDTLNMEDNIFLERAYKDALGQFMDARNLRRATPEAREYAKRRAFEATFKQTNKIYEAIVKLKKGNGAISKAVDIAMPFTKTPTNIMYRAIDYSPIGLVKSLYTKGKNPSLVIEDLAKGMTGTGVTALGFMLASMGWARGEAKSSRNAESITNMSGDQPNSIITPLGSYTTDWAQPISVPFAMGVAAYEAMKKENPDLLSSIYDSTAAGINTVFNMTMMSNVQDLLGGGYGGVAEGLMALPSNYVSQAMPTLLGQFARTVDDTKRSTYDPDPKKKFANTFISKTPFASKTLLPKLDAFGNEQKQGNAFQQFLSPGYAKGKSNDPATTEVARLYKSTKDSTILPKIAPYTISENNQEIKLTAQQINELQKTMGNKNFNSITSLTKDPKYQNSDDSTKADMMSAAVRKNYNDAKIELLKKYYADAMKKRG